MNAEQAWQVALDQLQREMSKASYDTWVRSTELVSCEGDVFTVGVQNAFARDWLDTRLTGAVEEKLTGMLQRPQTVQFVVLHQDDSDAVDEPASPERQSPVSRPPSPFNSRYMFENFVVGSSNRLAHAACMAVAESPAHAYNPLFLYGGVGLGKTHLLHAIGSQAYQQGLQVLYVSAEDFTNDLINAIRTHNTMAFRERYRSMDVLLIDDIQFIAGKESTQEEFFHTFNTLHGQEKQIVMTSDRPPKAMGSLEERLRSRFEWGLIVDIQPPDLETRIAILRSKADRAGRDVPQPILEMIAQAVKSNIRELEGFLIRISAYSSLTNREIDLDLVKEVLKTLVKHNNKEEVSVEEIIKTVAGKMNVKISDIKAHNKNKNLVLARQISMYLARKLTNLSYPDIGQKIGGRDHSTVIYANNKILKTVESDAAFKKTIQDIEDNIVHKT